MPDRNFIDDCINIYNDYCYPILFSNINRPAIWPVIVTAIIIFLTIEEISSQSCGDGYCNHYKNIDPSSVDDLSSKNIDTLISRIILNHTTVGWRRALIIAMLLSLIILAVFYSELPDGFDFFLVSTFIFLAIYLTSSWFQWNWWRVHDYKIEQSLLNLRHNVKEKEINMELNRSHQDFGDPSVTRHIESILY